MLSLPVRPVTAVSSWHSDSERLYGSDTLIASDQYDLDEANGRLILKSTSGKAIERGFRANKVVCTAGFGPTSVEDLVHAVCVYASQLQRAKQTQGKESTSQRDVNIKISPKTMPKEVKEILYSYRTYGRLM
jgi:TATA-box binding protein (TBP) (component of TFIID and TFIIIB)